MNTSEQEYQSVETTSSEPITKIDITPAPGCITPLPPESCCIDSFPQTPFHQKSLRNQLTELIDKHGCATVLDTFYVVLKGLNSEPDDLADEFERLVKIFEEEGL